MATEYKLSYTAEQIDSRLKEIDNLAKSSDIPTKMSELENDSGFITRHIAIQNEAPQDTSIFWVDMDDNNVDDAVELINIALAQAKESGEFDGKDGVDGKDGYTPVKGIDYYTQADKQEIVLGIANDKEWIDAVAETVKAEVPLVKIAEQPTFVNSTDEMTDTSKAYVMDGYLYSYVEKKNYNLLKLNKIEYEKRLDNTSSVLISSTTNNFVTDWFPVTYGKYYAPSIYRSDLGKRSRSGIVLGRVQLADNDCNIIKIYTDASGGNYYPFVTVDKSYLVAPVDDENAAYMRLQLSMYRDGVSYDVSDANKLKTWEPMIVEGDTAEEANSNALNLAYLDGDAEGGAQWYNTGLAYNQPASYEARVIELENAKSKQDERIEALENKDFTELALKGKKWTVVGDSHTEQNSYATKRYYDYIAEKTGITVAVNGIGGTGYKNGEGSGKAYYNRVLNISQDTDVVTLFTSNNDLLLGVEIGTPTDTTTDTICGCINKTIDNLFSVLPTVKLGIITNVPKSSYNPFSAEENESEKLSNAVVELCKRRCIPCLDLFHSGGLRPWDSNFKELCYKHDDNKGHFDEDGHAFIAPRIKSLLESIIM